MKYTHTLLICLASVAGISANAQVFSSTVLATAYRDGVQDLSHLDANTAGTLAVGATKGNVYSTATVINQVGILKTYASTTASGDVNIVTQGSANAQAYFGDSLIVTGSTPGNGGSLLINLSFEGRLTGQDITEHTFFARANSSVYINAFTGTGALLNRQVYDGEVNYANGSVLQYEIPFFFGRETPIGLQLSTEVRCSTLGADGITVAAVANFSNSLYWGGISGVRIGGVVHPTSEFLISSASGANYANSFAPVPEPAEYVGLFACGLVAFGLIKRRRI